MEFIRLSIFYYLSLVNSKDIFEVLYSRLSHNESTSLLPYTILARSLVSGQLRKAIYSFPIGKLKATHTFSPKIDPLV